MQKWDLKRAVAHVKAKRPQAHPYVDSWKASRKMMTSGREDEVIAMARKMCQERGEVCATDFMYAHVLALE